MKLERWLGSYHDGQGKIGCGCFFINFYPEVFHLFLCATEPSGNLMKSMVRFSK